MALLALLQCIPCTCTLRCPCRNDHLLSPITAVFGIVFCFILVALMLAHQGETLLHVIHWISPSSVVYDRIGENYVKVCMFFHYLNPPGLTVGAL